MRIWGRAAARFLFWSAIACLVVGIVGAFSPWTYHIYIWLFPSEKFAYANDSAGGPYPEIACGMLAIAAFYVAIAALPFAYSGPRKPD